MRLHLDGSLISVFTLVLRSAWGNTTQYGLAERGLGSGHGSQLDGWSMTMDLEARALDQIRLSELPQCGTTCLDEVLPRYGCLIDGDCFCNDGNVTASLGACVQANCTMVKGLEMERFHAEACDKPIRNRGPLSRGLNWAMFTIATVFVTGRFISRLPNLGGSGYRWDDWTPLFCYVLLIVTAAGAEREVHYGLGQDIYMLSVDQVVAILGWFYLDEILYNMIVMMTKVSLVLLYLRIWTKDSVSKAFRTISWGLIVLLSATAVAGVLVIVFQCMPISYAWLKVSGDISGQCIRMTPFTSTYGALNISYDIIVFFLPLPSLLKLKIPWPKKIGICSVFLVGSLVTICSIVRLQYLIRFSNTTNITWDFQYIGMWSLVEVNFSVVCCCMPAMAGLVQRKWSGRSGSIMSSSESDGSSQHVTPTQSLPSLPNDLERPPEKVERGSGQRPSTRSGVVLGELPSSAEVLSAREILRRQRRSGGRPGPAVVYRRQSGDMPHVVEIAHEPPTEASITKLSYRDHNDILHDLEIIDRPQEKVVSPGKVRFPSEKYPYAVDRTSAGRPPRPGGPMTSPHTLLPMERPSRKRPRSP